MRILFVDLQSQRRVKRTQTEALEIVAQLLDSRLMADRRMRVRAAGARFRRVFTAFAVHVIETFGLQVIWLKIVVRNRPGRRNSAKVADFVEVFPAQTKESRAVKLRVSADVVVRVRMERFAVLVTPFFLRLVFNFDVDRARVPVGLFAAYVVAAFD